jgi:hypothetical protein
MGPASESLNGESFGWNGGEWHRAGERGFADGFGWEEGFPTLRESGPVAMGARRRIEPRVPRVGRDAADNGSPLARPLSFDCPACSVVLVIREPEAYDGAAAPCPHCRVQILPPRIVYATAAFDLHPIPGLSRLPGLVPKSPRPLHRLDRRVRVSWRSSHGDILTAQ